MKPATGVDVGEIFNPNEVLKAVLSDAIADPTTTRPFLARILRKWISCPT